MKEMLFELKEKNLKCDKLAYTTSVVDDKINYCVSRVYISGKDGLVFEIEKTLGTKVKIKRFIIKKNGLCFFMNENEIYSVSEKDKYLKLARLIEEMPICPYRSQSKYVADKTKIFNEVVSRFNCPFKIRKKCQDMIILNAMLESNFFEMSSSIKKTILEATKHSNLFMRLSLLKILVEKGFNNQQVIINVINNHKDILVKDHNTFYNALFFSSKKYLNNLRKFYDGTNNNAEIVMIKRLENPNFNSNCYGCGCMVDTFSLYDEQLELEEKYKNKVLKIPPEWYKLNFIDLHDRLSELHRQQLIVLENLNYEYNTTTLALEGKEKGYVFKLPKNSRELSRLATVMSNCVAGYSKLIEQGTSIIMYAYKNKQVEDYICGKNNDLNLKKLDNSTICIELSPTSSNHKEILQSYLKHNQEITKEQRNILKVYFDKFDYSFSISNL